jgi:hypothetical protein
VVKYNVAFLGGGVNSAVGEAHFSSLNLLGNVQIVAGCFSRDSDINKMSGIRYYVNLDRLYTSLEELIVNERLRKINIRYCVNSPKDRKRPTRRRRDVCSNKGDPQR